MVDGWSGCREPFFAVLYCELLYTGLIMFDREELWELPWLEERWYIFEQRIIATPDAEEMLRKVNGCDKDI